MAFLLVEINCTTMYICCLKKWCSWTVEKKNSTEKLPPPERLSRIIRLARAWPHLLTTQLYGVARYFRVYLRNIPSNSCIFHPANRSIIFVKFHKNLMKILIKFYPRHKLHRTNYLQTIRKPSRRPSPCNHPQLSHTRARTRSRVNSISPEYTPNQSQHTFSTFAGDGVGKNKPRT